LNAVFCLLLRSYLDAISMEQRVSTPLPKMMQFLLTTSDLLPAIADYSPCSCVNASIIKHHKLALCTICQDVAFTVSGLLSCCFLLFDLAAT
jgi:hypothetical protein